MLRLTDIKLPLEHAEDALAAAVCARLDIAADELTTLTVAKRSYDARKRGAIVLIYSVDVETPREAEILRRLQIDLEAPAHPRDKHAGKVHADKPSFSSRLRATSHPHPTPHTNSSRTPPTISRNAPSSSAPAPAACSPA